jgi:hypothetical protein
MGGAPRLPGPGAPTHGSAVLSEGAPLGWQPSRFLTARGEAQRAFQLAEQLGSINAAAAELGTTWPSLRKALHGMGSACPLATPRPSASGRSRQPAGVAASRIHQAWTRTMVAVWTT